MYRGKGYDGLEVENTITTLRKRSARTLRSRPAANVRRPGCDARRGVEEIRTGGVTTDRVPRRATSSGLSRSLQWPVERPVQGYRRSTSPASLFRTAEGRRAPDAPPGTMHGFLNMLMMTTGQLASAFSKRSSKRSSRRYSSFTREHRLVARYADPIAQSHRTLFAYAACTRSARVRSTSRR